MITWSLLVPARLHWALKQTRDDSRQLWRVQVIKPVVFGLIKVLTLLCCWGDSVVGDSLKVGDGGEKALRSPVRVIICRIWVEKVGSARIVRIIVRVLVIGTTG
jgi:hypothetical protein